MLTKALRFKRILTVISKERFVKIQNLADELGVTERTIRADISELSCDYQIYTMPGKYNGGVYAMDGWYYNDQMNSSDTDFLKSLLPRLNSSEQERLLKIINTYGRK